MGDIEEKRLILQEEYYRQRARELHARFVKNHLEHDIVASGAFLSSYNVNYALYHEPNMVYLTHIPLWLKMDKLLTAGKRKNPTFESDVEETKRLLLKVSVCLAYDTPKTLRTKLEEQYITRAGNTAVDLKKALLLENLLHFPDLLNDPDGKCGKISAVQEAVLLRGAIDINDTITTLTIKPKEDEEGLLEARLCKSQPANLSDVARIEIAPNGVKQYRLLYFNDPLEGVRPN